jgi:KDO2-lipid IV(A) lauroyltransferase
MNDYQKYKLLKALIFAFSFFPKWTLYWFADFLGLLWFKIDKRHRDVVFENITYAFPDKFSDKNKATFVRRIFKNTARLPFEVIWSYGKKPDKLFKYFEIKGEKYPLKAFEKGRGVIVVTGHIGNFEFIVPAVAKAGFNGYGIYRKFDFAPLERLVLEMRQRYGVKMISTGGLSRKLDEILKANKGFATLLDQNAGTYNGVFVDFFNRPACAKNSLAKLALRTNTSVIPMFMSKRGEKYIMEFLPEIPLERTGCPIKDLERNTQNFVSAIETMIRRFPDQYFWVHNRWKTKPYSLISSRPAD